MKRITPETVQDNVFKLIGFDWMLVTAGNLESYNTMTASWGSMGYLWQRNVCFIFVRPQRYTYEFMEKNKFFTLTFFEEKYRSALQFCGTKSGRNVDKAAETGLTPKQTENGVVYFEEARIVIECRKLYYQDIRPETFIDSSLDQQIYPQKDYHRMYIAEIANIYSSS